MPPMHTTTELRKVILIYIYDATFISSSYQLVEGSGVQYYYHTQCLHCSLCNTSLVGGLFLVQADGSLICEEDVKQRVQKCAKCSKAIYKEQMLGVGEKKYPKNHTIQKTEALTTLCTISLVFRVPPVVLCLAQTITTTCKVKIFIVLHVVEIHNSAIGKYIGNVVQQKEYN